MNKQHSTNEARLAANIVMFFFTGLTLATVFGIWVKLFWFGWVMA